MSHSRRLAIAGAIVLLTLPGCGGHRLPFEPARGVVLIVLGGVSASHLGTYGAARPTSPFLDRLAERGVLFERAISQSPNALVANATLFTGLYPQQHGVRPPDKAISPALETLPERFGRFGFRTAGFTEGGFVGRHFGFHRGFDRFDDPPATSDTDIERTFEAGLDFLRELGQEERFFLFLHTRSATAPYDPPPDDRRFEVPPQPGAGGFAATAADLRAVDRGFVAIEPETAARLAARYDAGVAYVDGVLESFFTALEGLGLADETTIVVTADHGQEFLEHGRVGSFQVYPETIHVPLLVMQPGLPSFRGPAVGRRVPELVQTVDLAPTLYHLAGLPPADVVPGPVAGRSLLLHLMGTVIADTLAYAEAATGTRRQRTVLRRVGGTTHQLVLTKVTGERDGTWVTRSAALELTPETTLSAVGFHRRRDLALRINGEDLGRRSVGTGWTPLEIELPPGLSRYRLDLATDGCDSPRALGLSDDPRCLSFKLRGAPVRLVELFTLDADPLGQRDLAASYLEERRDLVTLLESLEWSTLAPPLARPPSEDVAPTLAALGYLEP